MMSPAKSGAGVPDIPPETKTLSRIVLDVKAPLNRKLDELRRTYGIREIEAGGFHFTDRDNQVVLIVETNRTLNAGGTQRVEEFLYRNRDRQLILHEKVITHGKSLRFHDFEKRLFQTGVESYDLENTDQTLKDAAIYMGGALFKVLTTKVVSDTVEIKRHQISVGQSQQLEIKDTIYKEKGYRTYEYDINDSQIQIFAMGQATFSWAQWLGTFRIGIRETPKLYLPEVTYEKTGSEWQVKEKSGNLRRLRYAKLNGFEHFSRELYQNLIIPFIENGSVRAVNQVVQLSWLWPKSRRMQSIGTESKFLNELIVIRNEVNQGKTNPSVLSLVEIKLNVIIKDIQEGKLKISDFR